MKKCSVIFLLMLSLLITTQGDVFAKDSIKIGISFSDFAVERWPREKDLMTKLGNEQGAEVVYQVANHDAKLQNDQIDNMILQGVDVIIIIAEDGAAAATAVERAAEAGVKTISYDRLIMSDKLSAYLSFDNVEIGRAQARGILKAKDSGKFFLLGGSPTDNCALLVRQGQMEVLQPYIEKGQIEIVADQWVENWDPANALKITENVLTAQNNNIDAIVASNDGTALASVQALEAQGLVGTVPISGQDATAAGCKSIVEGKLTMTVFNDIRLLAPEAIELAIKLTKGEKVEGLKDYTLKELTLNEQLKGSVPCYFIPVVEVDKDNVYDEIIKSEYQPYDEVYKDIPEAQRPPRP